MHFFDCFMQQTRIFVIFTVCAAEIAQSGEYYTPLPFHWTIETADQKLPKNLKKTGFDMPANDDSTQSSKQTCNYLVGWQTSIIRKIVGSLGRHCGILSEM